MLDQLIELAQIEGSVDTECKFGGTWQYAVDLQQDTAIVHIVKSGQGWLYLNHKKISIQTGDVLFFPHGTAHQFTHFQEHPAFGKVESSSFIENQTIIHRQHPSFDSDFSLKTNHIEPLTLHLFCAHFHYQNNSDLFSGLPELIHLNIGQCQLNPVLSLLEYEIQQDFGKNHVINALSEILLIYIFREFIQQHTHSISASHLMLWRHSKLSPLLHAILKSPELKWSLEDMFNFLHCSRIQLIRLFKKELDTTPHAFLLKIRLQHAALQLKTSNLTILQIASNLGFQSETHFGRVFKQYYHQTPHNYRNHVRKIDQHKP